MIDVQLSDNYRLRSDDRQFIVSERRASDPTKSPNWHIRSANDPLLSTDITYKWEDVAFYGLKPESVPIALEYVAMRMATKYGEAPTLRQFAADYRYYMERFREDVRQAMGGSAET